MYGPNKPERSTTIGQNGMPVTNTLAFWGTFVSYKVNEVFFLLIS